MKNQKLRDMTLMALFVAIELLLSFTPLGFIPINPMLNVTTMHIPVIIASIILGPKYGGTLGGVFGLTSMVRAVTAPTPLSFVFNPMVPVVGTNHGDWRAIIIALLPRILIGVVPYYVFKLFQNKSSVVRTFGLGVSGVLGSLTNSILVLSMIYAFFGQVKGVAFSSLTKVLMGVIGTNSIFEMIFAAVVTIPVATLLLSMRERSQKN
jgi:uncharacterized membrane protein